MIPLQGHALHGLDEFMLRLGHLKLLSSVAIESGGSAFRFERDAAERLNQIARVGDDAIGPLGFYLRAKRLCPSEAESLAKDFDQSKFRYPELAWTVDEESGSVRVASISGGPVEVTWQDRCLSADGVQSRVGAVNTVGKRGSKTGLSHIVDWAQMLDLISPSGLPSAYAQLLTKFDVDGGSRSTNPYLIGNERVVLAEIVVRPDFDVFSTLVHAIAQSPSPFRKKDAKQIYIAAVRQIVDRAESARDLSVRQQQSLFALWRDLRRPGRNDEVVSSTAWHRVASRLETYVDLGLLTKGRGSEDERYEYKYYASDRLLQARQTLERCNDGEEWISEYLAEVILGTPCSSAPLSPSELLTFLPKLVRPLERPTSPLPLNALSSGLVWQMANEGRPLNLKAARQSLESLAISRPEVARLSSGATASAEYISLKLDA